jgi:metal-sulfur cluster biosynthetic enzyme
MADPTPPEASSERAADAANPAAPESSPSATPPGSAGDETPPSADQVKLALRKVKDPELNLNIIDLGLVYDVAVDGGAVQIDMTLTSPGCPAGPQIMGDVERAVKAMAGVDDVNINLVWEPFWSPDKIEPRVRAYMGL